MPKVHANEWSESVVDLKNNNINITVYIDFQKNSLSTADYANLKSLASRGISNYWSKSIAVNSDKFKVTVNVKHRQSRSIDVDLVIEKDTKYGRSHNSGLIDASFIYNIGFYRGKHSMAERDFMLVSAHEFGHSVLEYFGDSDLSWTHKGSTNKFLQNTKPSTPGFPSSGEIDLMKFYDSNKNAVSAPRVPLNKSIMSLRDLKRSGELALGVATSHHAMSMPSKLRLDCELT